MEQYQELGARPEINYVQIFENRGAMMGASNPPALPDLVEPPLPNGRRKSRVAAGVGRSGHVFVAHTRDVNGEERVVEENEAFLTVVPFWAVWPFETMVWPNAMLPVDRAT